MFFSEFAFFLVHKINLVISKFLINSLALGKFGMVYYQSLLCNREIIVADNGQAQYGSTGRGGSLNYSRNNAEDISQSVQKVVDSFAGSHKVSTYLWDTITRQSVQEYSE